MTHAAQIAKQFREVHFGGNWTGVNLKDTLAGVDWQQAACRTSSLNTIALLVFHINYYVSAVLKVLEGHPLDAHDKFSFSMKPVESEEDWNGLLTKFWADAEKFSILIEKMPDSQLWELMADEKYGDYYRNIHGIIQHTHYHLGQIALVKKLLQEEAKLIK